MISTFPSDCLSPSALGFGGTGYSNTPLNSQRSANALINILEPVKLAPRLWIDVSIDHLSFSIPVTTIIDVEKHIHYLGQILYDEFDVQPGKPHMVASGRYYNNKARSTRGCIVAWELPHESSTGKGNMIVVINGKSLRSLNFFERVDALMTFKHVSGAKCTRIDLAVDDYAHTLTYEQLSTAAESGNISGARKFHSHRSGQAGNVGWTVNFGSRKSESYLRVYDKNAETKGEINAIRCELELKGKKADAFAQLIYDFVGYSEEQLKKLIIDTVFSTIDFLDRSSGDRNLERLHRLDWWQAFLDILSVSHLKLALPKPEKTLEKTRNFLAKQVSTSLAMVREVYGQREFNRMIRELLADGRSRFTGAHDAVVRQGRKTYKTPITV